MKRAKYESTRFEKAAFRTLPERVDATEVAAAPRKERKRRSTPGGSGQSKNEGGGTKGWREGMAHLLASV